MELPDWIVQEVGRLHLHALALERELAKVIEARDEQQPVTPEHDHEASGFYQPTPNTGV